MTMTIRRTALSLASLTLTLVATVTSPVFAAPTVTDTITVGMNPNSVAFSPNGKKAYVANIFDDTVSVITVKTGAVTDTISVGDGPYSVAFSPNGKKAYVSNSNAGTVSVITVKTGVVTNTISVGGFPELVAFTPNGKKRTSPTPTSTSCPSSP